MRMQKVGEEKLNVGRQIEEVTLTLEWSHAVVGLTANIQRQVQVQYSKTQRYSYKSWIIYWGKGYM